MKYEKITMRNETPNKRWFGHYRGIMFEIQNFAPLLDHFDESWCHYIYLVDKQFDELSLPSEYYTAFGTKLNRDTSWCHDLEFHGGCTYCKVESVDPIGTRIKVGCDYQHYWDEGRHYDLGYVKTEVVKTIDSVYEVLKPKCTEEDLWKEFRKRFENVKKDIGVRYDENAEPIDEAKNGDEGEG